MGFERLVSLLLAATELLICVDKLYDFFPRENTFQTLSHPSVLGGVGPWGGDPSVGSRGALHHRVAALHGGAQGLRGVAGALPGACLVEGVLGGVQTQEPVPVLEPGRRLQLRRLLAAPSAAWPSSRRT